MFFLIALFMFLSSCEAQNNNMVMDSVSTLHYRVRESNDSAALSPLLILLHGHGSNENDLFSLAEKVPDHWTVITVRGPYQLSENSYRWYDVKMVDGKISIHIEQEEKSRKQIMDLIDDVTKEYNIDTQKIVAAGFSQGANMAQALGLGRPEFIAGFGVFSGRYVEEFIPFISPSITLNHSKAFIAHGSGDNMLPKKYAEENIAKLKNIGVEITYCEDTNGHSISIKQWNEFNAWLLQF